MDSVPEFLDEIIAALRADAGEPVEGAQPGTLGQTRAAEHGTQRRRKRFDLDRVVHDCGVVCDTITQLARELDVPVSLREIQILNRCVDEAIALAAESYLQTDREEEARILTRELTTLINVINASLGSAGFAFDLIRRGAVAANGPTAQVVTASLARAAENVSRLLAEVQLLGTLVACRQAVEVAQLFATVVADTQLERGIQVVVEPPPTDRIEADPHLLRIGLGQLVRNAVERSADGATIVLRARKVEASVALEVEDRCGGLPDHRLRELSSADATVRPAGGVPMARRAAEAHGGTLHVHSQPGVGCVFAIQIPASLRVVDEPAGSAA